MRERLGLVSLYLVGVILILHGLAHAVLPLRGAGVLGGDPWVNTLTTACYTVAMIGFVAAGVGALGLRPFSTALWWLTPAAAAASLIAFRMLGDTDLWPGMALDVALAVAARRIEITRRPSRSVPAGTTWRLLHGVVRAAVLLLVAYIAAAALLWPWHRSWGVTAAERAMALPGDPAGRQAAFELMHGVTIDASPDQVWPWLIQIGQDRAGFYSYDWLERMFLVDIHNANEIRPEWQTRRVGDFVRATQPRYLGGLLGENLGWFVTDVQPGRALVLHQWGAFVLREDARGRTRLLVRSTFSAPDIPVWAAAVAFTGFELPHFIMERRMLLGIKARAERHATDSTLNVTRLLSRR